MEGGGFRTSCGRQKVHGQPIIARFPSGRAIDRGLTKQEESEGLFLANASKYGLGAGLWTQDIGRAHRLAAEIEAGLVWINTHHRNDPSSPWGGMKESGIGRENGIEALESCERSALDHLLKAKICAHCRFTKQVDNREHSVCRRNKGDTRLV